MASTAVRSSSPTATVAILLSEVRQAGSRGSSSKEVKADLERELSPTMVTKTKLYTRNQYDELVAATGGEGIDLLPYVNRRLLDRVAAKDADFGRAG